MEFALSTDQAMLADSLNRALERACPLARVKSAAGNAEGFARDVWAVLCSLGVPAILAAPEHGGLGLGLLDAALAAESLGRFAAPVPFLGSALCVLALEQSARPAAKAEWLPRLASGEASGGAALSEAIAGARDGAGLSFAGGRLSGTALFAADGDAADVLVCADANGTLYLVRGDAAGLSRERLVSIDATRGLCALRFAAVPAEALGGRIGRLRDAAFVLLAADTLGAGTHMLEAAVSYAKDRQQFGRLIGSFQAVKHLCAEMAAGLEPCRALVWYAAHAFDMDLADASAAAAHAKAHVSEAGTAVARTATEVHGGIGITDLLGLHYWFKRIGLNRQLFGGPDRVRHLAAVAQGFVPGNHAS